MRAIPEHFETGGVVRARLTATLASRVTAPVEAVLVAPGARVRRGATLLTLECRELDANAAQSRASLAAATESARAADADLRAAESGLTLARSTHERMRPLFEKRSATPQEWDQSSAAVQEAEARSAASQSHAAAARSARDAADAALRAAETALSYGTIAAPFDGVVSERLVDPGTLATAGAPLLVVEDPSTLRLHVLVDEFRARTIAAGQAADAKLDDEGTWIPTRVAEVGRVDAASHTFLVKLDLPSSTVTRSGLFGRGRFTTGARQALVVPAKSVIRRGELTFVFAVAADGTARLRPIVIGETAGDGVEVLAGLVEGDLAIVNPPPALADGTRVTRQP
jgi:multidrug efflux pump subunit AcrA (membrane-fusion protein)